MNTETEPNNSTAFSSTGNRADWSSATQQRRRSFRRWISISHYITFYLGRKFPNAIPLVYVIGYPKSGTTWVCQLLADYLQLPFPQHSILPVGCPAVVHGHEVVASDYPQGIYVLRDGRDVAISAFHHLRKHSQLGGKSKGQTDFFKNRKLDQPTSELLPEFIGHMAKNPFGAKCNWGQHVQSFFKTSKHRFGLVKYEDLVDQPTSALSAMVRHLTSESIDDAKLNASCHRLSFQSISGRSSGTENNESYLRKGTYGDWKNYFTRSAAQAFCDCFGDALIASGYETSLDWIQQFPVSQSPVSQSPESLVDKQ